MYQPGDHVYPQDLPRRFLCRVIETENLRLRSGKCQVLKLAPLEGPWPLGTTLIRLDKSVRSVERALRARRPAARRALRRRMTSRTLAPGTPGEAA